MARNFFEEFIRSDFFEKKASENENIKSALNDVSPEILEKLAEQIGVIAEDDMLTLEQKLASNECCENDNDKENPCCKEKEEVEEKKESSDCKEDEDEKKESSSEDDEEEENKESSDSKEDDEEEKKESSDCKEDEEEKKESSDCKEDEDEKKESSSEDDEEEEKKESSDCKEDKEASALEDEMIKEAYELATAKLSEQGISLDEYVFNKCANEEVACFIAENAEKLAYLTDNNILKIADDILDSLAEKMN